MEDSKYAVPGSAPITERSKALQSQRPSSNHSQRPSSESKPLPPSPQIDRDGEKTESSPKLDSVEQPKDNPRPRREEIPRYRPRQSQTASGDSTVRPKNTSVSGAGQDAAPSPLERKTEPGAKEVEQAKTSPTAIQEDGIETSGILKAEPVTVETPRIVETPKPAEPPMPSPMIEELTRKPSFGPSRTPGLEVPSRSGTPGSSKLGSKKRLSKRGKACVIRVPAATVYSERPMMPLTTEEFQSRLNGFVRQGYHTGGFDHAVVKVNGQDTEVPPAADAPVFPTAPPTLPKTEVSGDDQKGQTAPLKPKVEVRIPNQKRWDNYVNDLMEQKLAALGVSLGNDEPEPEPEQTMDMSRDPSSSLRDLAASPPEPPSSAFSQGMSQNMMPFSAPFSPAATTNNTSMGMMGSPAPSSMGGQPGRPGHMAHPSTFGFPFPSQIGQPLPSAFSPRSQNISPAPARTGSAMWSQNNQRIPSTFSQASQEPHADRQATPRGFEATSSGQASRQKPSRRTTLISEQSTNTNPQDYEEGQPTSEQPLSWRRKDDSQHNQVNNSYGQLEFPTPQGHRHNISEGLEREAEKTQFYPYQHGEFQNQANGFAKAPSLPFQRHQPNGSEQKKFGHTPALSMASNSSASKLNVEAKEFKFGGDNSHLRSFSIPKTSFAPQNVLESTKPAVSYLTAHANGETTGGSSFKSGGFKAPAQSDFSFASKFNFPKTSEGEASAVREDKAEEVKTGDNEGGKEAEQKPGIFGRILADIVKPGKKSKAIPIVNPNALPPKKESEDEQEDESGRISRQNWRTKRGRTVAIDADDIPKFDVARDNPLGRNLDGLVKESSSRAASEVPESKPNTTKDLEDSLHDFGIEDEPESHKLSEKLSTEQQETPESKQESAVAQPKATKPSSSTEPSSIRNIIDEPIAADETVQSPSLEELDAIMDRINGPGQEQQKMDEQLIEDRSTPPFLATTPDRARSTQGKSSTRETSRQPSALHRDALGVSAAFPPDWVEEDSKTGSARRSESPVKKLNNLKETPVSDWDDVLSPGEENKFFPQVQFFDGRVKNLIEEALRKQLEPINRMVIDMGSSVNKLSTQERIPTRALSALSKTESDADDEDDSGTERKRTIPPTGTRKSEKRLEQIKAVIQHAMATAPPPTKGVDDVINGRIEAERKAGDLQKMLDLSEREIEIFKESSEQHEIKLAAFEQERKANASRLSELENIERELRGKNKELSRENGGLTETLSEYRSSANKFRQEVDSVKQARESMGATIERLKHEAREAHDAKERAQSQAEKLQESLNNINHNLTQERSTWQRKDEESAKDLTVISTKLDESMHTHERLEREIDRLKEVERDTVKVRVALDEIESNHARQKADNAKLRHENISQQDSVAHYEREAKEAKDIARAEIQRITTLLKADVENAEKKYETMRADLETRLRMTREEVQAARENAKEVNERFKRSLDELSNSRQAAIRDATENASQALMEERQRHQHTVRELTEQHDRALKEHSDSAANIRSEERRLHEKAIADLANQHEEALSEANEFANSMRADEHRRHEEAIADLQANHQHAKDALQAVRDEEKYSYERMIADIQAKHDRILSESTAPYEKARNDDKARYELIIADHKQAREDDRARQENLAVDLRASHEAAIESLRKDKQQRESHLAESVKLTNERNALLEDKIKHLEDKVKVAQSAAHAAATAAQEKARASSSAPTPIAEPAVTQQTVQAQLRQPSERVSPQALRESIVVLQEQLQERETQIEEFESKIADLEGASPEKLKARDTEITWLRELLGVRVDDLNQLCNILANENFNRAAARDAAIRIRSTVQMEQHVKERAIAELNGTSSQFRGPALPSLSDIQNFASPRANQLAQAWSSWRKGSNLRDAVGSAAGASADSTPSKPPTLSRQPSQQRSHSSAAATADAVGSSSTAAQNFLSGLMTPPATDLRRTPSTGASNYPSAKAQRHDDPLDDDEGAADAAPLSLQMSEDDFGSEPASPIKSRPASAAGGGSRHRTRGPQVKQARREVLETPPLLRGDEPPVPVAEPKDEPTNPLAEVNNEEEVEEEQDNQTVEGTAESSSLQPLGDELAALGEEEDDDLEAEE